jgi:pSer/pThr/pTyr-binding forkhead associated (FHA) protein
MKAELVPENGDPPIPITGDLVVVGRRGYCDVTIDHPSLSKRHCVIVKTDGLLVIRDLISTNGTKVKGQRIRWAALLPDDRIAFGSYKLRVYLGPDHVPAPSERYQERSQARKGSGKAHSPERRKHQPAANFASTQPFVPSAPPSSGLGQDFQFAPPSPIEIDIRPDEHDRISPGNAGHDSLPELPINFDDSDEFISLD